MKLLILTQKVNREDDVLGFFERWLRKLAEKSALINVICLWQGQFSLPSNVRVWSLGKEKGKRRLSRLFRFYKYILNLRQDYDAVFVHMNPIYVLLGGLFWKIRQKRIYLWFNHEHGTFITRLAIKMTDRVFYTSPFSFAAVFQNAKKMPAGIDTELFKPKAESRKPRANNSILYLGRLEPIKKVEVLIEAAKMLDREGEDFVLNIVGGAGEGNETYFRKIKEIAEPLEEKGKLKFWGKVLNCKTPEIYNQNELFVNLSPPGLFDKTVLEAMACGILVLASSPAFREILPECLIFQQGNARDLKNKIIQNLKMPEEEKEEIVARLKDWVKENHNLDVLVEKIIQTTTQGLLIQ